MIKTLAIVVLCTAAALADTYPRQPAIDVIHYTFRISLSDVNDEVSGDVTVDVRFVQSAASFSIDLASAKDGKGMNITEVSSDAGLTFVHESDRLTIQPLAAPLAGERRLFRIRYHGVPRSGLRILKNKFGQRVFVSDNWP